MSFLLPLHLPVSRHQLFDSPVCLSGPPERNCGGSQECSIGCIGDSLSPTAPLGICGGLRSPLSPCLPLYGDRGGCSGRVEGNPVGDGARRSPILSFCGILAFPRLLFRSTCNLSRAAVASSPLSFLCCHPFHPVSSSVRRVLLVFVVRGFCLFFSSRVYLAAATGRRGGVSSFQGYPDQSSAAPGALAAAMCFGVRDGTGPVRNQIVLWSVAEGRSPDCVGWTMGRDQIGTRDSVTITVDSALLSSFSIGLFQHSSVHRFLVPA